MKPAPIDPSLALLDALVRDVARRRAPLPALRRAALTVELLREAGPARALTLVCEEARVWLHEGDLGLPGAPRAWLQVAEADLVGLARGTLEAGALMQGGRLAMRGDAALLRAFGECLRPGERWWQLRGRRGGGSRDPAAG